MPSRLTMQQRGLALHNTRLPAQYVAPCFFGNPRSESPRVNNGSASLIKVGDTKYAVTNKHVIDHFRKVLNEDLGTQFYIGSNIIDIQKSLIAESDEHDICLININQIDIKSIEPNPEIKKGFFEVTSSNVEIKPGDFIMFAGYPGEYRLSTGQRTFNFGLFCHGGSLIEDANETRIIASIAKDKCEIIFQDSSSNVNHYGGISGGPAFYEEKLPSGLHVIRLAGFIYQDAGSYDAIFIKPISFLFSELLGQQA